MKPSLSLSSTSITQLNNNHHNHETKKNKNINGASDNLYGIREKQKQQQVPRQANVEEFVAQHEGT